MRGPRTPLEPLAWEISNFFQAIAKMVSYFFPFLSSFPCFFPLFLTFILFFLFVGTVRTAERDGAPYSLEIAISTIFSEIPPLVHSDVAIRIEPQPLSHLVSF